MINLGKTYFAKPSTISKKWFLVDAKDQTLGRLASQIAKVLRGKHKVDYTPHMDCGDNIVVINAKYVKLTGKKLEQKTYYRHTGYPGGIKKRTAGQIIEGKFPTRILNLAVKRMLPKESPLARKQLKNLHIFAEAEHLHEAQKPTPIQLVK
jgi:large subunit ribosomal protein L13